MLRSPLLALFVSAVPLAAQTIQDDTGLTALAKRLGAGNVPTGAGIGVGHVEALQSSNYAPDTSNAEFAGKTFTLKSGASGPSGHATTAGRHFYGLTTGIAPGIDDVHAWEAGKWLSTGFLNGAGIVPPKDAGPVRIFSCSWIADTAADPGYLRKLDAAIDEQDLVVVVGVDNGSGPLNAGLLAQGFGTIAVGRSDGNHAAGGTTVDIPGRMKPELVAPGTATSWATPLVGGAAALLLETAATHPGLRFNPRAARSELLKAVLLAGAEKRAGWSNGALLSGPLRGWTDTPLDPLFGADEVDVNQSHWILTSLEQPGAFAPTRLSESKQRGWNVISIGPGESRWWRFEVSVEKPAVDAVASWHRLVSPNFQTSFTTNCNLRLWAVDEADALISLVGDAAAGYYAGGNVTSESLVDSVELLHVDGLQPGLYALELVRPDDGFPSDWQVAVAWGMTCPEPDVYCTAKTASPGCVPRIDTSGEASAADPNRFEVLATDVVNLKNGLLFYGFGPAALPFQGGLLCVQPPLRRTGIQNSGGNPPPDDCSGAFLFDMRAEIQSGASPLLVPGADVSAPFWFRDPADGAGVGLTDAVHFAICQ